MQPFTPERPGETPRAYGEGYALEKVGATEPCYVPCAPICLPEASSIVAGLASSSCICIGVSRRRHRALVSAHYSPIRPYVSRVPC